MLKLEVNIHYEDFKFWISDGHGGTAGEVVTPNSMVRALANLGMLANELKRIKEFRAELELIGLFGGGTKYNLLIPDNIFEDVRD